MSDGDAGAPPGASAATSGQPASEPLELTVTDLKQFAYCPRIPYYHYVLPVGCRPTYAMTQGKLTQAALEALERRRRLREYGLESGRRLFGVSLRSARLALTGKLDLVILAADAAYPVDFKSTEGPPRRNHRLQLAAYAVLVEEALSVPVPRAFLYLAPRDEVVAVDIGAAEREAVVSLLGDVRRMLERELMPEPTAVRERCGGCEFRNYCADIW